MPYRRSTYIDFDTGTVHVSPMGWQPQSLPP